MTQGLFRFCTRTVLQWVVQAALGTWQGQVALAQGYAEADWGPQLAKKYLHDEAKITKRLAREMETAAQICQIAVLDHQN